MPWLQWSMLPFAPQQYREPGFPQHVPPPLSLPSTQVHNPGPQLSMLHELPGAPPLMLPHPPHPLQLGLHQSSFWSAAHCHEPQQP
jgi:hypothetical protein